MRFPIFLLFALFLPIPGLTFDFFPQAPSGLSPEQTEDTNPHPTFQLEGVEPGDMVMLYSNATCSRAIGFAILQEDFTITVDQALPVGDHTIYSSLWRNWISSPCSQTGASYRVIPHPPSRLEMAPDEPDTLRNPVIVVSGVEKGDRVTLYRDSHCTRDSGWSIAQGTEAEIVSEEIPLGSHKFYAQTERNYILSECSMAHAHYMRLPAAPHSLSVPEGIRGINTTPVVRMGEVETGDIVTLYTDPECTQHSGTTTAWGTEVAIISHPLEPGYHRFHAQVSREGLASPCSEEHAVYEVLPPGS